ncbi:MAG: hypothetical protein LBH24_02165 [Clostridiales bacterium]|nr:hypothetical protein [Clostridiales bacterium]
MLIDIHIHTSPVSLCGRLLYSEVVDLYAAAGYGAVMLTNHYSSSYQDAIGVSYQEWLELYIGEYERMAEYGKSRGLKVFFGAEVTTERKYADYLLIGIDAEFLRRHPRLYMLLQSELYALCEKEDVLLVQAHPFRVEQGHSLQDTRFLHGLEINCHPMFSPFEKRVLDTAAAEGLTVTVGGDVHTRDAAARCGLIVPDGIGDAKALRDYLKETRVPDYRLPPV